MYVWCKWIRVCTSWVWTGDLNVTFVSQPVVFGPGLHSVNMGERVDHTNSTKLINSSIDQ